MRLNMRNSGFTLVELLVAMAIFVIMSTILVSLFQGGTTTVRIGDQMNRNYEMGRSTLELIARDLQSAVSSQDFGYPYSFYGRPEGFTFLHLNEDGSLSRVTYAVVYENPSTNPDKPEDRQTVSQFTTEMMTSVRELTDSARKRGQFLFQYNPVARQRFIINNLTDEEQAGGYFAQLAETAFRNDESGTPRGDDDSFDIMVSVNTYSLIRFEEKNRSELDSFELPTDPTFTGRPLLAWPELDPADPSNDDDYPAGVESSSYQERLADSVVNGVWGTASSTVVYDLRNEIQLYKTMPGYTLLGLDEDAVDQLFKARKREVWIRMLSGTLGQLASMNYSSENYTMPFSWWQLMEANDTSSKKYDWRDHIVASGVASSAYAFYNGDVYFDSLTGLPVVDLFFEPGMFSYGNGQFYTVESGNRNVGISKLEQPVLRPTFNDIMNVNGWIKWASDPVTDGNDDYPSNGIADTFEILDHRIEEAYQRTGDQTTVCGTPLAPTMPASVCVRFWVLAEKPTPSSPDFKKLFTQLLDVPVGASRNVPNTVLPSPG